MKKKNFLILLVSFLLLPLVAKNAFAHGVGQAPYFVVNGVYSNLYFVPGTSLPDFPLPQDDPREIFLVNQSISMVIDTKVLGFTPEVKESTLMTWDMGDGTKASGYSVNHNYTKQGSYIVKIFMQSADAPSEEPQLIESCLINVLPNKDYILPKAVINMNGSDANPNATDLPTINLNLPITLDGQKSQSGSGKIVSYFWDFGDGTSGTQVRSDHKYDTNTYDVVFPVLRVTDENGFFSDTFIGVRNQSSANVGTKTTTPTQKPKASPATVKKPSSFSLPVLVGASLFIIVLVVVSMAFIPGNRRKRRRFR